MPTLDRRLSLRGPSFWEEATDDGPALMFAVHYDGSTRSEPRPATKEDSLEHPEAWARFTAGLVTPGAPGKPPVQPDPFRSMFVVTDAGEIPSPARAKGARAPV